MNITIIGGGNLGTAIAEGLVKSNFCKAKSITLTKRNTSTLVAQQKRGMQVLQDNKTAVKTADVVLLAVKPFQIHEVLKDLAKTIQSKQIIISVITGVGLLDLEGMLPKKNPIFRAMPNTAVAIGESMTCISSLNSNESQKEFVQQLFETVGKVVHIEDKLMDAATVLGACGTAYAMRYIRANIQGGIEIGFDSKTASLIAAQTVKGAAELLLQNNTHPEQEIDKVTTPKGCTIAGLNEMEHQGFSSSLIKGIATSFKRITGIV